MRCRHSQALAARTTAVAARHVGRGPGLVDEDEALRIEIGLALEPVLPAFQDVGTALLAGVRRLFLSVTACRSRKRQSPPMLLRTPLASRAALISASVMSRLPALRLSVGKWTFVTWVF